MPGGLSSNPGRTWGRALGAGLLLVSGLAAAGPFISNVNSDQARYAPGAGVTLSVALRNPTLTNFSGSVALAISHLGLNITNLPALGLSLSPGATNTAVFSWLPPVTDYQGYLVGVSVLNSAGTVVDTGSSAVDVSSDWARFPRYGYVAHFDAGLDATNLMWQLKNYHLNGIQFYDWQWKHHLPYNAGAFWPDVANRTISRGTLTAFLNAAHAYGMMAMNYNSYGMAYSNYLADGSGVTLAMGIFSSPSPSQANQIGYAMPGGWATPILYETNNRDTNWQNYIFGREQTVFAYLPFDGWHIDTVGQHTAYDYSGNFFNLDDYNPQFINQAKAVLNRRLAFNTVDAGGEDQVAQNAQVDFVYSELWGNNANYRDFNARVDNVRRFCGKALVLPAYLNSSLSSGFFNEASVRLADAAIFACGASHLELGDGDKMLHQAYFPDDQNVLPSGSLAAAMHSYYDFLVGYENLLRDGTVSAANSVTVTGAPTSFDGSAGSVWLIRKKTLGYTILHLVNLANNPSTAWRDDNGTYPAPASLTNLAVKLYYSGSLGSGQLWYATPDANGGAAVPLVYSPGSDAGGNYVTFTVPQLQYWDMVWLQLQGTNSAAAQTQAENYDSMSAISTESTSDTGGGLDVGSVNNVTGDSWLAFNRLDFGLGATSVSARVASAVAGGLIEFRLDSPTGPLVATMPVGNTGGWQNWQTLTVPVSGAAGVHHLFVVFKQAASNLNWFNFNLPLPSPWTTADVGAVGLAGSAALSAGTFTVSGAGADIWGTADAFRLVAQTAGGPCELRARVAALQNTDPWAKAGVMCRADSSPGSVFADVVVTPGNGVNFQWRATAGGPCANAQASGLTAPLWVRLTRSAANVFAASWSADGTNWTQIGTGQTLAAMPASASVGLAVTAHTTAALNTATFDHVTINTPPVLAPVANRALLAGATLVLTNSAADADLPAQSLAYGLLSAPAGAAIGTNNGIFTWRPTMAQSPSTQLVAVVVADNGVPPMSSTQAFTLTVTRPTPPVLSGPSWSNGGFQLWVNGDAGPDYTILTSTNLTSWQPVFTEPSATPPLWWADTNSATAATRFYRVVLGP